MAKKIGSIVKKIVVASFIIYGYNVIASPLNIIIPINFITVSIVTVLGIPSLVALVLLSVIL